MLDTHGRVAAATPTKLPVEFLRVELSPAKDGSVFVAVRATSVDEPEQECFELIEHELANDHVSTIDAALALVCEHARRSFATA
jgi:hypothetical protein